MKYAKRSLSLVAKFSFIFVILLSLLPIGAVNAQNSGAYQPVSFWEAKFSISGFNSYCDPRSNADPSIELYHYQLAYCIDAFVNIYRATNKTVYLDEAIKHISRIIATAKPSTQLGSNAYNDEYWGWATRRGGSWAGKEVSLDEIYLWRYVGTMLRVMKENNLHTSANYQDDYNNILYFSEKHIFEKWYSRRGNTSPGDWIYRQNTNVSSHSALLASNLAAITTDANRKALYEEVIYKINYDFPYYPTGLKQQLSRRNSSVPTAAVWNAPWDNSYVQDHSHSNAEMSYIAESITMGRSEWSKDEVPAFTSTLIDVTVVSGTTCTFNVDGSGGNRSCWVYDGYAKLGRHDGRMQKFLETKTALHNNQTVAQGALNAAFLTGSISSTPTEPSPTPQPDQPFSFVTAGDFGFSTEAAGVLAGMGSAGAEFGLALGDFGYQGGQEAAWCDFVKQNFGANTPFQLIIGNHDEGRGDGKIEEYVKCLPNQINPIDGEYGIEYAFDYNGLVRLINIAPNISTSSGNRTYAAGTAERQWLDNQLDSAVTDNIDWVIVSMHKNCITMGQKSCEITPELMNHLIAKKVDLILQGHEHGYMRTKLLAHSSSCSAIVPNTFSNACVAKSGKDFTKGNGTVIAIVGTGGIGNRNLDFLDEEAQYFDAFSGANHTNAYGYLKVEASNQALTMNFVATDGSTFFDQFEFINNNPLLGGSTNPNPTQPPNQSVNPPNNSNVSINPDALNVGFDSFFLPDKVASQQILVNSQSTCVDIETNCGIVGTANQLISVMALLVMPLSILVIAVGGIQYTIAGASVEKIALAKATITKAVLALTSSIFVWAFLQWLIPGGVF